MQPTTDIPPKRFTRRGLMTAAFTGALFGASAKAGRSLGSVAGLARPGATGRSGARCAQCGADDHAMLGGACPAGPAVV